MAGLLRVEPAGTGSSSFATQMRVTREHSWTGLSWKEPACRDRGYDSWRYAIGAGQGYIYCRAEYPLAVERLAIGIDQARQLASSEREHSQ